MRRLAILLAALLGTGLASAAAEAQTFKWLDERGVVNYSNAPPPGAAAKAAKAQTVDERISTYEPDPALKAIAAAGGPSYYEQQLEREWAQRQRLMAMSNAAADALPCNAPYRADCGDAYAGGYGVPVVFARPLRATFLAAPAAPRPARAHRVHRPADGRLLLR